MPGGLKWTPLVRVNRRRPTIRWSRWRWRPPCRSSPPACRRCPRSPPGSPPSPPTTSGPRHRRCRTWATRCFLPGAAWVGATLFFLKFGAPGRVGGWIHLLEPKCFLPDTLRQNLCVFVNLAENNRLKNAILALFEAPQRNDPALFSRGEGMPTSPFSLGQGSRTTPLCPLILSACGGGPTGTAGSAHSFLTPNTEPQKWVPLPPGISWVIGGGSPPVFKKNTPWRGRLVLADSFV